VLLLSLLCSYGSLPKNYLTWWFLMLDHKIWVNIVI
jgi:hypothetical protein